MRMQKGICIELDGDRSVYMLSDGRFVTGKPLEGTIVGTEAYFEGPSSIRKKGSMKRLVVPVVAAVAVLFLVVSAMIMPTQEAYGYVQIESNPGIELGVDENWLVISVRKLNMDGERLLEQLDPWEGQSLETVLQQVLALSVTDETEQVTITTVQEEGDTKTVTTVEQIALAAVFANAGAKLRVHMKKANKAQWREANEQQVPVARLVEENRTFTSPLEQRNDVQPAQNEDNELDDAEQNQNSEQTEPAKTEDSNEPAAEPKDESSPTEERIEENSAPSGNPTPSAPDKNNGNGQKPISAPPAAKEKQAKPAVEKPTNSTGNKASDKKETPGEKPQAPLQDKEKGENKGAGQNQGKPKEKPKQQPEQKETPKGKSEENGSKTSEEKGNGQGNNKQNDEGKTQPKASHKNAEPESEEEPGKKAQPLPDQAVEKGNSANSRNKEKNKND